MTAHFIEIGLAIGIPFVAFLGWMFKDLFRADPPLRFDDRHQQWVEKKQSGRG